MLLLDFVFTGGSQQHRTGILVDGSNKLGCSGVSSKHTSNQRGSTVDISKVDLRSGRHRGSHSDISRISTSDIGAGEGRRHDRHRDQSYLRQHHRDSSSQQHFSSSRVSSTGQLDSSAYSHSRSRDSLNNSRDGYYHQDNTTRRPMSVGPEHRRNMSSSREELSSSMRPRAPSASEIPRSRTSHSDISGSRDTSPNIKQRSQSSEKPLRGLTSDVHRYASDGGTYYNGRMQDALPTHRKGRAEPSSKRSKF